MYARSSIQLPYMDTRIGQKAMSIRVHTATARSVVSTEATGEAANDAAESALLCSSVLAIIVIVLPVVIEAQIVVGQDRSKQS